MSSESYIVCEGFHDRAFWAGWLLHLGCSDPGASSKGQRVPVIDPWGDQVGDGHFAFQSKMGHFIRVVPAGGVDNVLRAAVIRLDRHDEKTLKVVIINVDHADVPDPAAVLNRLKKLDATASQIDEATFSLHGSLRVSLIPWQALDPPSDLLPAGQTLERLACAAIAAAHPQRAAAVRRWLDSRPSKPEASVKEFSWSHMAGWYADRNCESFYQALWEDTAIRDELVRRLKVGNCWDVIEAMANS